jgi:hypothetical protein
MIWYSCLPARLKYVSSERAVSNIISPQLRQSADNLSAAMGVALSEALNRFQAKLSAVAGQRAIFIVA